MKEKSALSNVTMFVTRDCLVVPIQTELSDELILKIQKEILEMVKETGVKGLIIDISGVDIIDLFLAKAISDTAKMAFLLGSTAVLTGLKPGVVSSLVDLDFEIKDIKTAITLENGFQLLESIITPEEEPEYLEPEEELEEIEEPEEESREDKEILEFEEDRYDEKFEDET